MSKHSGCCEEHIQSMNKLYLLKQGNPNIKPALKINLKKPIPAVIFRI